MKLHYRTIFISDTHLGSRGCQARDLVRFLSAVQCETLYLVGDIIDLWRLKSRWYWPAEHNQVVQRILQMVREGTCIIYIPGNHDEAARQYSELEFGGVRILPQAVHETARGQKLLITHGDQYDLVVKHSRLLSLLGSAAYEWLIAINRIYNTIRRWRGKPYWSLSKFMKQKVKSACTFISRFEEALIREARHRGLCGVVCGHIHKPEEKIDTIRYYNCGDWVESCTAVVEYHDGMMEVIEALPAIAELARRQRQPVEAQALAAAPDSS
jgi:UDP-2,3-diacylglucosamine pyrophosphatase LpxH